MAAPSPDDRRSCRPRRPSRRRSAAACGLRQRRIERPEGRARSRTGRPAAEQARQRPPERHEARARRVRRRQQVVRRRPGRRPARRGRCARRPVAELLRRGARSVIRDRAVAAGPAPSRRTPRRPSGVRTRDRRRHEQDARGWPWTPRQRRHALAATLDERRAAGQEERHVGADGRGGGRVVGRRRRARRPRPRARRRWPRPRRDDPPPRPAATGIRFSSRAARAGVVGAAAARPTARRAAAIAAQDEVVGEGPASRPVDVEAVVGAAPARREAQPVGERERDEHRVQVVEAVRRAGRRRRASG